MEYVFIFIAAVFVNNIVLAQFLGICPFLGVSKSVPTALGMTGAVTFVMILATLVTFIVQKTVLDPFRHWIHADHRVYLNHCRPRSDGGNHSEKGKSVTLSSIRSFPTPDHDKLCRTWCSHHGDSKDYNLLESVVLQPQPHLGFGLALTIFAGIREQLELSSIPQGMKGTPIALVTAGLLAMAFMGFSGIV